MEFILAVSGTSPLSSLTLQKEITNNDVGKMKVNEMKL